MKCKIPFFECQLMYAVKSKTKYTKKFTFRSFPSFRPRFVSDLTQDVSNPYSELTQGYNISCSIITYDNAAQKYSAIFFFHHPGN